MVSVSKADPRSRAVCADMSHIVTGPGTAGQVCESRALVPVGVMASSGASGAHAGVYAARPAAPFLAQLIAVDQQAPQMRVRNRIDPRAGAFAYRQAACLGPARLVSLLDGRDSVAR